MCTYWASRHKVHSQEFMYLRVAILIYSGVHLCVYFLYQFPCAQKILDDSDLITSATSFEGHPLKRPYQYTILNRTRQAFKNRSFLVPILTTNTVAATTTASSTSSSDNNDIVRSDRPHRATAETVERGSCLRGHRSVSHGDEQTATTPVPAAASVRPKPAFTFSPHLFPLIAHGPLLLSIHNSVIRNSYVLTFIAMMVSPVM
ncbi:unnamed protein product [Dibothriocephalus latus]|uniref:Piezo TM1-24 domain-containing protein n=1 Tax=Dibothriocephalus latus TaxID=60516 RepID=A0A3P7PNQ5_DIBLA|nr:unnamed protein product [Dibothriocephalus latus]